MNSYQPSAPSASGSCTSHRISRHLTWRLANIVFRCTSLRGMITGELRRKIDRLWDASLGWPCGSLSTGRSKPTTSRTLARLTSPVSTRASCSKRA